MSDPTPDSDHPLPVSPGGPAKLDYGRETRRRWTERTPEEQRRDLLVCVAFALLATLAWWLTLFCMRRPALAYFCVCVFLPEIFAFVWLCLGWQLLKLTRRDPELHRRRLIPLILLAFLLAPYCLRAGRDMFTASVRYHLWRAGGADKVRAEFNQWVAIQPSYDKVGREKMLFFQPSAAGNFVPVPAAQLPPKVRYIHEKFPSGFGTTWDDVVRLHNVSAFTTTNIMIGPPGWEPKGEAMFWNYLTGNRRKLADGIWIEFGLYNK